MSAPIRSAPGIALRRSERDDGLDETIASYDKLAVDYAKRYSAVDMSGYYERFLDLRPSMDGWVLDAGCGSGRDTAAFEKRRVSVIGLDLSSGLLSIAAPTTNAPLVRGDLRRLPFRGSSMVGVWACASLVHLSPEGIRAAMSEACRVLAPRGALFASLAHGSGSEWRPDGEGGQRWFSLYDQRTVEYLAARAGFRIVSINTEPGVAAGMWVNLFATRL